MWWYDYQAVQIAQVPAGHAYLVTQRSTDMPCCPMRAADHSVFVGDLAPEVNDYTLQEHFRQYFSSVRSAKVCPWRLPTGTAVRGVSST